MTRNQLRETKRAANFLIAQIKKGWTVEEAFEQVENAYSQEIRFKLQESFRRVLA